MSWIFVGALTASAAIAGIYAVAATSAAAIAAGFNPIETQAYTRSVAFSAQAARASAEHDTDRAKCTRLAASKLKACNAAAKFRNARGL